MDLQEIRNKQLLLLDCVSGSRAYGLHTQQSDTDLKGVFLLPEAAYFGLTYTEQVNNTSNDEVYYELKRFVDLLAKNNPNILELLHTPDDCIRYRHPVMDELKPEMFLSRLCYQTFAGYAQAQIKKARGLKKKIVNPVKPERKSVLDFCYIAQGQGSVDLSHWLQQQGWTQEDCGLVGIPHMREVYALFHNDQFGEKCLRGISSGIEANDVSLSSVKAGYEPLAMLSFNKDGYSGYCRDYREYWDWVEKRNDLRYEQTQEHGKNYDAKNMMHTFRLLHMAEEIAREGKIRVRRPDREFLLKIRSGHFAYGELLERANEKIASMETLYKQSDLPEMPDVSKVEEILVRMRQRMYRRIG